MRAFVLASLLSALTSAVSLAPMSIRPVTPANGVEAQSPAAPAVFDSSRAWEHLRRQVSFGPRPAGSAALNETRRYILAQLASFGIKATEQKFIARTPLGEMSMGNIVATIPGRRSERVILASHFDTKRAPDFRFVGANDGASSTAALIELGRVLQGRRNDLTIELLFLDGEEAVNWDWGVTGVDNTYGSRHYVDVAQKTKTIGGIRALILLDMIGERNLLIRRDARSTPWLVDLLWSTAKQLGHGAVFSSESTDVEDDHVAFLRAGVPAVDVIDLEYPQWHTAQDDLDHVSAGSLQIVGDVVVASLPAIEKRAASPAR